MVFSTLSENLQSILLYNYEVFNKSFFLLFMFSISLFYHFYYKKANPLKTVLKMKVVFNMLIDKLTFWFLVCSPFTFLIMNPYYSSATIISPFLAIFSLIITLSMVSLFYDLLNHGWASVFAHFGLDMKHPQTKQFFKEVFNKNL